MGLPFNFFLKSALVGPAESELRILALIFLEFSLLLFYGHRTAVMTPSRRAKNIHEFMVPITGFLHIRPDILELVRQDNYRIVRVRCVNYPVFYINTLIQGFVGAKHPVKNIEDTPVVLVQVLYILSVVHLVHGVGIQKSF